MKPVRRREGRDETGSASAGERWRGQVDRMVDDAQGDGTIVEASRRCAPWWLVWFLEWCLEVSILGILGGFQR